MTGFLVDPRRLLGSAPAVARHAAAAAGAVTGAAASTASGTALVAGAIAVRATTAAPSLLGVPAAPARAATRLAGQATVAAARTGARAAEPLTQRAAWTAKALADLHPYRVRRRVWVNGGHTGIEVRGLEGRGTRHQRIATSVQRRLTSLPGVSWASVNAVTGQVLVGFDEGQVDVASLLEAVRAVEEAHGTRDAGFTWSKPVHPADTTPAVAAAIELAADCVAVGIALVGKLTPLPPAPRAARAALALIDTQPRLHKALKRRLGPIETDVVLSLAAAAVQGVSHGPGTPAIDALYRMQLLRETLARRAVWLRRERELCGPEQVAPTEVSSRPPRPGPRPKGPIEQWSATLGPLTLGAAGTVLALTGDPGRAADAMIAAIPKAARFGREGYATTIGQRLAAYGVVPLNAGAYRRLDLVSAVVVDSAMLRTDRAEVLAAEPVHGTDVAQLWRLAGAVVHGRRVADLDDGDALSDGEVLLEPRPAQAPGSWRYAVLRRGRRIGDVTVGAELHPLADGLLDAAQATGARVLLTEDASTAELLPRADEVLDSAHRLAEHVRRLQGEGNGVLVLTRTDDDATAVADVGVGLLGGKTVCWSADLLCGPGLEDVIRLLHAARPARPVSEQAVRLAQASAALGGLLALVGGRRGGRNAHVSAPVYSAAFVALLSGRSAAMRALRLPLPPPVTHVPWHALDALDVLARLDEARTNAPAPPRALSLRRVPVPAPVPQAVSAVTAPVREAQALVRAVREELDDPLTPVLGVGAAASAIVGSGVDALLVTGVMSGNAAISGLQRFRAERVLNRLISEQEVSGRRLRRSRDESGRTPSRFGSLPLQVVPGRHLVPGDVIALRAHDVVPADARLLSVDGLEVDEATLTGESNPVTKSVQPVPGAPLAERTCMVFAGTTVLAGTAYAVVVATGDATEAGRAARAAGRSAPPAGVQARLGEVTRTALPVTGIGGAAVTGLAMLRRVPLREAVAAGVSVAVAAVPEGLPLVATVAQAAAARRLSAFGVLVRSSRTLEALGRVDTICFDKTGTLTEGRLAVSRLATRDGDVDTGSATGRRLLTVAARACPPADVSGVHAAPHATDRAVLEAAVRIGGPEGYAGEWGLETELAFSSDRGYAASLGMDGDGRMLAVKGAPEVVLPRCRTSGGRSAQQVVQRLAADGLRVLAVAERRVDANAEPADVEQLVDGLELVGFVGIADTPRADATDAVRDMAQAGVRVVMVTGDHPTTAAAIARSVGLPDGEVVTGADLERMTERERIRRVARASVFARVSPEQKVRIVEALRAGGRVVAMTGDGTNDAAAIRLADVGIGVAAAGSTAARTAADLVLADAQVGRIRDALMEGRSMWLRVRDAVSILVGGNAGEVAFMVLGTAIGGRAPIGVRQLLLVNVLTDMFPALAVAVAPSRRDDGATTTPGPVAGMLGAPLARAVAARGTATAAGATSAWLVGRLTGRHARASTMGLAALVGTQLGQTLVTGWRRPLVVATSLASVAVLFTVVETPGVSQFFGCTPLGPFAWAIVVACSAGGTVLAAVLPRVAPRWLAADPT